MSTSVTLVIALIVSGALLALPFSPRYDNDETVDLLLLIAAPVFFASCVLLAHVTNTTT